MSSCNIRCRCGEREGEGERGGREREGVERGGREREGGDRERGRERGDEVKCRKHV